MLELLVAIILANASVSLEGANVSLGPTCVVFSGSGVCAGRRLCHHQTSLRSRCLRLVLERAPHVSGDGVEAPECILEVKREDVRGH